MKTVALFLLAAALPAAAQQFVNADVRTQEAGNLAADVRTLSGSETPVWIGWTVPMLAGHHQTCGEEVDLESGAASTRDAEGPGSGTLVVLLRAARGQVEKVRSYSTECRINAGGSTVTMLTGVEPAASVAELEPLAASQRHSLSNGALYAIAMHAGPAAEAALDRFVEPGRPDQLREQAIFWLGAARGRAGYEKLSKIVREDASPRIREKAVFGLYVSHQPEATDAIISVARNDTSPHVRSQALFWLGQSAAKKSAEAIANAIEYDPDTDVKKKAVFALSRLPDGEGVTKLIEVARTNRNPAVRKQAMFWLGQSGDPRALEFFEDILKQH